MQTQRNFITPWRLYWFIAGTLFGIIVMVVPLTFQSASGESSIDTITFYYIKQVMAYFGMQTFIYLITGICVLSSISSLIYYIFRPTWLLKRPLLHKLAAVNFMDLVFRLIGTAIALMVVTHTGPEFLINKDTGGTMVEQATQLAILVAPILFFQTFILEFGFMEFLGTLIGFTLRPLFKISPLASVSLLSAWLVPGNAAVISSKQLYDEGYFTHKEAVIISTTFAISSIGWIVVICTYLGLMDYFWTFFGTLTFVGVVMGAICVRIYPLNRYQDLYINGTNTSPQAEDFTAGQKAPVAAKNSDKVYHSVWAKAFNLACKRLSQIRQKNFTNKFPSMLMYMFNLTPVIICWGTIALCLVTFFPTFFNYFSAPFAWLMELLGISNQHAHQAAPLIVASFADNYLPIALLPSISEPTLQLKFIIGILSILQLIYLSEIGILLMQNKLTRNFWDILIIFIERTVIALVLTTIISHFIFK
ncbi:YjiH family protein [Psittacicella hinzii]|uniref:Uncharacterized protein n=1 Tax=Psittacicella hinzii TaxID=2028575 RepID=A0A3A1YRL2_9GAMM|nr:nucleoside recognition protein [Psittacicella hinzii]RIY40141.1 hypothetical protein CKF58_00995 [Psittacicella hinzii]